jgi:cell division protein FtsI/penicillin-binding protein 2
VPGVRPSSRAGLAVLALFLAVAAAALAIRACSGNEAEEALDSFLADWSDGKDSEAADATDDPAAARAALGANREGLDGARLQADRVSLEDDGDAATATVRMRWQVPGFGRWDYETAVELAKDGDWKVHWEPTVVHPKLDSKTRLGTTRQFHARAAILDREDEPLVTRRPVAEVGFVKSEVEDPAASVEQLAALLDLRPRPLLRALRGAGPEQFVPALTLREDEYLALESQIELVPDVEVIRTEAQLAPTREFARALLGAVGPATAEQLERLGAGYKTGDEVGQWGLQERFERRLAGTPTFSIVIRARGVPVETLDARAGARGKPLRTTLDATVQGAAETALAEVEGKAALVAVQPSTGDILAVANRPTDSTYDRALEGRYPPGSTFKVVSTSALLRRGFDVDEIVDCPATIDIGGKQFRNFEGGAAGAVPFTVDFAESCNTAFVSLADQLEPESLPDAARDLGLGEELDLPLAAFGGEVPPGRTEVEEAAAMIGQHEIVASPLGMAGVAGAVAAGRWQSPRLVAGDESEPGEEIPDVETLRELMRLVVTQGTGTALAAVPGEPGGKSGTAEFGSGDPPPTHAWFIAYRGDLAVSVLVEEGEAGGTVAAPVAASFLQALDESAAAG